MRVGVGPQKKLEPLRTLEDAYRVPSVQQGCQERLEALRGGGALELG